LDRRPLRQLAHGARHPLRDPCHAVHGELLRPGRADGGERLRDQRALSSLFLVRRATAGRDVSLTVTHRRLVSRGEIPGSGGGIYNPGAVLRGPSILMLCRREVDYRFTTDVHPEMVVVDPRTLRLVGHRTLGKGAYPAGSRIEDFRTIEHDGALLVV